MYVSVKPIRGHNRVTLDKRKNALLLTQLHIKVYYLCIFGHNPFISVEELDTHDCRTYVIVSNNIIVPKIGPDWGN